MILGINYRKLSYFYNSVINNIIIRNCLLIFLFFYFFMWFLPQGGGYSGIGNFNAGAGIIKNTLFKEITNLFMIMYDFIDINIYNLPKVVL